MRCAYVYSVYIEKVLFSDDFLYFCFISTSSPISFHKHIASWIWLCACCVLVRVFEVSKIFSWLLPIVFWVHIFLVSISFFSFHVYLSNALEHRISISNKNDCRWEMALTYAVNTCRLQSIHWCYLSNNYKSRVIEVANRPFVVCHIQQFRMRVKKLNARTFYVFIIDGIKMSTE